MAQARRQLLVPGGGCALPGLRSYDLRVNFIHHCWLKLPVLTASKSQRRSRKAVAVSRPGKRSAAGRSGSVPVVVPDGSIEMPYPGLRDHTTQAHTAPCANAALM
ncbi:hypothetical protein LNP74_24925 [Klebsiella pneumoniae subsp. pneumoniae]|nr:hypothetical protein [Klebsiella pneumoniae subsp. pneumoniae]